MSPYPLTIINRILVALNFPGRMNDFISKAKSIFSAMKNNAIFSALLPTINLFGGEIDTLDTTETAFKTKPPTKTRADRNVAKEAVKTRWRELARDVQDLADADPENAEAIITAATMDIKKSTIHQQQGNTAKNGPESGTVILTAQYPGPHNWRMSTDNITWTLLPASKGSRTIVTGLTPRQVYYFQNCRVMANGETGDWSQSIKITVI